MSSKKELRTRTGAVQSVQRITKSMEMIAAAKLKRIKNRMERAHPYISSLSQMIQRLIETDLHYTPGYLVPRPLKKVGILVLGSDLGLCGSLNLQLFRQVMTLAENFEKQGVKFCFVLLGEKAVEFFSKFPFEILAQRSGLGTVPQFKDLIGPCRLMIQAFEVGAIDAFYMAYNRFVSTTFQKPQVQPILPLSWFVKKEMGEADAPIAEKNWDYIYESDPKVLLDSLLLRSLESLVYQHVMENLCCVQAARMCAMQNASTSAKDLLEELKREQHKLRQSGITQELMEIVSGATVISE